MIPQLGTYCPTCGALRTSLRRRLAAEPLSPPPRQFPHPGVGARRPPSWRLVIKTILAFGMLTFVVQLLVALAALVYGTGIVLPEIVHATYTIFVIAPVLIAVGTISGDILAAYYLIIVVAIIASALWLFLSSYKGFVRELRMKAEPRKHSALFDLCGLMFGVLFLNVVIVLLSGILWEEPTAPTEGSELWELLFLLANASVWEELIVRVLLIGVPLLLIDLVRQSFRAKRHRYILGGGFTMGAAEVTLILASSALFGFGHYDSWGAWKVFPSAVAGVAFGYMFLKHGLASAIMLHFGFDYLSMPMEVFSDGSDLGVLMLLGLAVLAWVAMGAVFFGYYVIRMIEFVTRRTYFDDYPPRFTPYVQYYTYRPGPPAQEWSVPPPPDAQTVEPAGPIIWEDARREPPAAPRPPHEGFFVCPACGFTQARWKDGRFQCLRCGTFV